jgi:O-methyltransferase involved in polyketide biosynthesis
MNKDRLEWVMSGLNQYVLTQAEDQFLKTALEDFGKNHMLTEHQEDRLESLYKEKSQSIPNKKSNRFSVKKSEPKKVKPQRPRGRVF